VETPEEAHHMTHHLNHMSNHMNNHMSNHMSNHVSSQASAAALTRPIAKAGLTIAVTALAVIVALVALYAVFLDQGQLLSPALGSLANSANYLHELAHDGRHLLGAPCH